MLLIGLACVLSPLAAGAACATVRIEISQEVTLERQAFDAHMRINNGSEGLTLTDVSVEVTFRDAEDHAVTATSETSNTNALFFITVNTISGISDVSGSGVVNPGTVACGGNQIMAHELREIG